LGHIFSVNKDIRPKTCIIEGHTVNQRDTFRIRGYLNLKRKSQGFIDNGYAWFPLKSIKTTHTENTPVYNFEVEEDNSYTVSNISVHNCQPFSIAGNQAGFEDSRSNVFWKMLEIIQYHKPSIILIENVKNLKTHDKGNTFQIIHSKLVEKGYHLKYTILDTGKYTNVPQHRERIYIVGFRDKNLYDKFDFDFDEVANDHITDFLEEDIPEKYYYTDKYKVYPIVSDGVVSHVNNNVLYQFRRYYVRENKSNQCPTLTANMGTGGHNVPLLLDDNGIRKLTPRECFNLQGFPKDYQLPNLCDSDLYKLAGNAVSIPIVELIVEKIKNVISE
jgi:DNA (cytosine-5)-methyltransferase 1